MKNKMKLLFAKFKGMSKKKKAILILIILAVIIAIWSPWSSKAVEEEVMVDATAFVDRGEVSQTIYATGKIVVGEKQEVTSAGITKVIAVRVKDGDNVKKGQILFDLEDTVIRVALEQSRLQYSNASNEYSKIQKHSGLSIVKSTGAGKVEEILVKNGDEITPDTIVAKINNTDNFELVLPFNVNDVKLFKVGKSYPLILNGFDSVQGKVKSIDSKSTAISSSGGIYKNITFVIKNPGALAVDQELYFGSQLGGNMVYSLTPAKLTAMEPIEVKANIVGKVNNVYVSTGKQVEYGSVLVSVDKDSQKLAVVSKRLEMETAKADYVAKQEEYEKCHVKALYDGIVSDVTMKVGEIPPTDKPCVKITNYDTIKFTIAVEELDMPLLKMDQSAIVILTAFPDKKFAAKVSRISQVGKSEGGNTTYEADLTMLDTEGAKVDMTGDTDIFIDKRENVLRLPKNAVFIEEGNVVSLEVKKADGTYEFRDVTIGLEGSDYVEILSGLQEGEEVKIPQM